MVDYVAHAKTISTKLLNAEASAKDRIREKMKHYTIEDVAVLHTMLRRCAESRNSGLKEDLERHNIPNRLKALASKVSATHSHSSIWHPGPKGGDYQSFFGCIAEMHVWSGVQNKVTGTIAAVGSGIVTFGFGTAACAVMMAASTVHAFEVEKDVTWVVNELESLYQQTNSIMIASLV